MGVGEGEGGGEGGDQFPRGQVVPSELNTPTSVLPDAFWGFYGKCIIIVSSRSI